MNALRAKLIFLVVIACQAALFLGEINPLSWWEGP